MNKYNEITFCNNIINKYNVLISKKIHKSKSYSRINDKNNSINKKKKINIKINTPIKNIFIKNKQKKFEKLRNYSSKVKTNLLCLKNPYKSNFVQNILNELIPKNIRKPYGIKNKKKLPYISNRTEPNKQKEKNNKTKLVIKKANNINSKIENVTYKYLKKDNSIKYINNKGKFISNFLTPFNIFMNHDFNLTNNEYYKLINNINDIENNYI